MEQTQIISPWVFYWIDVLSKINIFSIVAVIIALSLIFFLPLDDELVIINKAIKKLIAISIICTLVVIIIPSQSTMYKMLIANEVTYERAETVVKVIDEKVEAIMNRIDAK